VQTDAALSGETKGRTREPMGVLRVAYSRSTKSAIASPISCGESSCAKCDRGRGQELDDRLDRGVDVRRFAVDRDVARPHDAALARSLSMPGGRWVTRCEWSPDAWRAGSVGPI